MTRFVSLPGIPVHGEPITACTAKIASVNFTKPTIRLLRCSLQATRPTLQNLSECVGVKTSKAEKLPLKDQETKIQTDSRPAIHPWCCGPFALTTEILRTTGGQMAGQARGNGKG